MNVLFTIRGNEPFVSQQAQIELMIGLKEYGVNTLLIGNFSDEVAENLNAKKVTYEKVYPKKSIDKDFINDLKELVDKYQIDLVHSIDGKSTRNALIALKKTNIKIVTYFGSTSLHWYDPSSYLTYLNSRVDAIIANSQYVYEHVKKQLFGSRKNKVTRIYKGYNPRWFAHEVEKDMGEFGIPKEALVVTLVGNHRKVKGTKYFLESSYHLKTDKEVHYVLVGDNTDHADFQKLKANSPIGKNIHLLERRYDVISILKSSDIYAQTSLEEGFGRAISEAMCVGKPIVMTDAGGCTELIDENSGIVVPKKDSKAIGTAISSLINNDELRETMGNNAKERINTVYHISQTVKDTYQLYQSLIS